MNQFPKNPEKKSLIKLAAGMLNKEKRAELRAGIFRHLDGIATAPTAFCLHKQSVLSEFMSGEKMSLSQLAKSKSANEGYLNVALRILSSQGWLIPEVQPEGKDVHYVISDKGKLAFPHVHIYENAVELIPVSIELNNHIIKGFSENDFANLKKTFEFYSNGCGLPEASNELEQEVFVQMKKHVEGLIAAPLIVALGMNGLFHNYFSIAPFRATEYSANPQVKDIIDFFATLGWFTNNDEIYNFTDEGLFFAKRASAYGVTVSYLPTFSHLDELIFGNPRILWDKPDGSAELHVNRTMNVWGSGGAHAGYFKKVDEIVEDIFNRPIEDQPIGFLDMGCGNGAFIEHIFNIIWKNTKRGEMLEDHPLFIVGADFNDAALVATRETLNNADIWAKVVPGDISDPDLLAKNLNEKYQINLGDLLNVRSFLDHNRIFANPAQEPQESGSLSTGAFCFRGERIKNAVVEQNLLEHFQKWAPYVEKFGLLVIELHTIPPELTRDHLGRTAATAYDATHGYSDQYILELPHYLSIAEKAGLNPVIEHMERYPNSDLATVSINLLKK